MSSWWTHECENSSDLWDSTAFRRFGPTQVSERLRIRIPREPPVGARAVRATDRFGRCCDPPQGVRLQWLAERSEWTG